MPRPLLPWRTVYTSSPHKTSCTCGWDPCSGSTRYEFSTRGRHVLKLSTDVPIVLGFPQECDGASRRRCDLTRRDQGTNTASHVGIMERITDRTLTIAIVTKY